MSLNPKVPDIDKSKAQGLLLIEYAFSTDQDWDFVEESKRKKHVSTFIELMINGQIDDMLQYLT